jgi:hypothetical protein
LPGEETGDPFLGAERAEQTVARAWSVDPGVTFKRRLGKAAASDAYDAAYWDIVCLYDRGEPLLDYFQREIAPLPPPTV